MVSERLIYVAIVRDPIQLIGAKLINDWLITLDTFHCQSEITGNIDKLPLGSI